MGHAPSTKRRFVGALGAACAVALIAYAPAPAHAPSRGADPVHSGVASSAATDPSGPTSPSSAAGAATAAISPQSPSAGPPTLDLEGLVERVHHAFLPDGDTWVAGVTSYERRLRRDGTLELTLREPATPGAEASVRLGPSHLVRGGVDLGPAGSTHVDDDGVAVRDGEVVERFANDARGIEQTWTLAHPPIGEGDVAVSVPVHGMQYVTTNATGIHLVGDDGLGLRYGHATLVEADGDRTALAVRFERGAVRFDIPERVLREADYPVVVDPVIGAEVGVDGAAPGSLIPGTSDPAVAWNGSEYLAVWVDTRVSGLGPGIYGSRLNAAGVPLDIGGVLLARSATETLAVPVLASNVPDYLLVWRATATAGGLVSVRAARITSTLNVLDPSGLLIGNSGIPADDLPIVASDGADYAVSWIGRTSGVLANGTVTDPGGLGGAPTRFDAMYSSGPSTYVVCRAFSYVIGCSNYYVNPFGSGMWTSGNQFDFGDPDPKSDASVACVPSAGCFFAWTETTASGPQIRGGWVSSWTSSRDISALGVSAAHASVTGVSGSTFYISYETSTGIRGIHSASFTGAATQPFDSFGGTALGRAARLASDGTSVVVMAFPEARFGRTTGMNTSVPLQPAAIRSSVETTPAVAGNGAGYLVAWQDDRIPQGIYSARVTLGGSPLDALGRFLGSTSGAADQRPSVASDGTHYAVAWNGAGAVVRRVDGATGAPLDAGPLGVGVGGNVRIASNGTRYLAVGSSVGSVLGRTVTSGGVVEGGGTFTVGTGTRPAVASNGAGFLVAWESGGDIRGGRLSGAGAVLDGTGFVVSADANAQSEPAIGSDGTNYLVAWSDLRTGAADIVATRIDPALVTPVLDAGGIVVSSATGSQTAPAIAWNGTEYLVVWNDGRGVTTDIFGTRVATNGGVEDATLGTAFAVMATSNERDPSLGGGLADANLLAYARDDIEPPFLGVSRVRARALAYGSWNGSLCTDGAQCDSGFCVDGVCCATACAGGTTDCQACAVTAGAATDGVCGLVSVFQAHVCRVAAGACDAPERCSGSSVVCPPDGLQAPGSTCRSSIGPCDVREVCSGYELDCPPDLVSPSGTACRDARGACDVPESCDGAAPTCPADSFHPSGFECRASGGACDVAEVCDGATPTCPGDAMLPIGTTCRASVGICDVTEYCVGAAACPPDGFAGNTTQCDVAHDECDFADFCTGASSTCPETIAADGTSCDDDRGCTAADACAAGTCVGTRMAAGEVCRASQGGCDVEETCDGVSDACPSDAVLPVDSVCRPAVGPCDAAEICDGYGPACPGDVRLPAGAPCRTAVGACDLEEQCTGLGAACPQDLFKPAGSLCRSPASPCDATEYCEGSALCPSDGNVADGTPCSDGLACTLTSACQAGACAAAVTLDCSDGDACTTDLCVEPTGCTHAPIPACMADAGVDAGRSDAGGVDAGPTIIIIQQGCTCRAAGTGDATGSLLAAASFGLGACVRRRRRTDTRRS